jgi:hypothetical protein
LGRPRGKPRSPSQTCPEILLLVLRSGRRSSLNVDRGLKGSPQSKIVDACDVVFENGCSLRII